MTGKKEWTVEEYSVPVPFGFIKGKYWRQQDISLRSIEKSCDSVENNNQETQSRLNKNGTSKSSPSLNECVKYLALHGWQDNSGTWDELIPLLLQDNEQVNIELFAIDLPGHGFSSHYPEGCAYTDLGFAMDVKRVVKYLDWNYFSILGHSMGGYIGIFYASLFPENIEKVIAIDIVKPLTFKSEDLASMAASSINSYIAIEEKLISSKIPKYSKEESVARLLAGHAKIGKLTHKAAHVLLKRGSKKTTENEDLYFFTRDPRLGAIFFSRLDVTTVKAYLSNLKCHLVVIKAKSGIKLDDDEVTQDFIQLYKKVCKSFSYVEVDGPHHVQLCAPENIVEPVVDAILMPKSNGSSDE